mmetsp:Transcript_64188/g.177450  ORF Transcript_64188/g.177450 Transcript_64188/m.177450 type:complete len:410 (-) Transcript_64188:313-1542(-)
MENCCATVCPCVCSPVICKPFIGPKDPACYCGMRGCCEGFVNCFLLPYVSGRNCGGCGKWCVVDYIGGPINRTCDCICGFDSRSPDRPSSVESAKGVVVLTIRPVKDVAAYKAAYSTYAQSTQNGNPGVRAMFSFAKCDSSPPAAYDDAKAAAYLEDAKASKTILQVAWYDSPEILAGIAKDDAVEACYDEITPDTPDVWGAAFGNRSDVTRAALGESAVKYEFGSMPRGFMKSAPHQGFSNSLSPGPPMIWMSKRWVQSGKNPAIASAFGKAGDLQYHTAPAFLSGFEYSAEDNPDQLWSLRYFNDYEMGHVAHFPKTLLSWVPTRVLFTMIPLLKGGLGAEFPVGLSFSTKEDIAKAIAYNGGNAAYDQYYWENVIGPLPDMGKGMPAATEATPMVPGGAPSAVMER